MIEVIQMTGGALLIGEKVDETYEEEERWHKYARPRVVQILLQGFNKVIQFAVIIGDPDTVWIDMEKAAIIYEPKSDFVNMYREAVTGLAIAQGPLPDGDYVKPFPSAK